MFDPKSIDDKLPKDWDVYAKLDYYANLIAQDNVKHTEYLECEHAKLANWTIDYYGLLECKGEYERFFNCKVMEYLGVDDE